MSDVLWATLIGGGLGILASLITQVVAGRFAEHQLRYQSQQAAQSRLWAVDDAQRARAIEVVERRCEQAEQIVGTLTEEFHRLAIAAHIFLTTDDKAQAEGVYAEHMTWRSKIDLRQFTGKPAIQSLRDKDLTDAYRRLSQAGNDVWAHADYNFAQRFVTGQPIDLNAQDMKLVEARDVFEAASTDFFASLDRIRVAAGRESAHAPVVTAMPANAKHK
jgi:predicted phage tail protein